MHISNVAIEHLLDRHPVARLATLGEDRSISQVPIVFARDEGIVWSPVDGKPKTGIELTRVRNMRRDPHVSLLLDEYTPDWSRLWWIHIRATATIVDCTAHLNEQLTGVIDALKRKYPQYDEIPVLSEPPVLIALQPHRISSWCAQAWKV